MSNKNIPSRDGQRPSEMNSGGSSLEQEVEHHVAERAYKDDSAGYPIKLRQSRLGQSSNINLDLLSSELTNYIRRSLAGILICRVIVNPVKDLNVSQFLVEVR